MNPYEPLLRIVGCSSFQDFYSELEIIVKTKMGLDAVPFPLSALEHPPGNIICPEIDSFLKKCMKMNTENNSEDEAIKLIKFLKENPPQVSFENPKLPDHECTQEEDNLICHIFSSGVDLPGSKHNLFGHLQYFSTFFIDLFFGNYTEFMDHITTLSKEELESALKKREGYCQFSPIFAPIIGLRMVNLEFSLDFTKKEKQKIRTMYSGFNENKHFDILKELVKLGADVNAHDINGFTALHYSIIYRHKCMVTYLLKHGANPNSESRNGYRPLALCTIGVKELDFEIMDILIIHNSKLTDTDYINLLRTNVELNGSKELAVRVRQVHPREKEECEKCSEPAKKKCSVCMLVYYCTPACQKLDWKFHKVTCQKRGEN